MKHNIKLAPTAMTPLRILSLARNVVTKMSGNAHFPNPMVPLSDITTLADRLEEAIERATDGSRLAKLERDAFKEGMSTLLRSQADYVRAICQGDASMLQSSGFELTKPRKRASIPGTAVIRTARMTGQQGQVQLRWNAQRGARVYQVWMTATDPTEHANWVATAITSRVSIMIEDLESFKAYWFAVSAIGTAGEGVMSDPILGRAA
jgi:hypothetical protein